MNKAVVAVAGAGKTERLAEAVAHEPNPERVLVLTYTVTNQREDAARIARKVGGVAECPRVIGWCAFLLDEIVLPYLPALYPGVQLKGLAPRDPATFQYLRGRSVYLNNDGRAYPSHLGKLALDVIKASNGSAIGRLECLYDRIYIDEAQDLRGNDLCVIEKLLRSSIEMKLVLDPRQSTLSTAERDRKYASYACAKVIELYRQWEKKRLLEIEFESRTRRFTPQIAAFSDLIFGGGLGFEDTVSDVQPRGYHDGVFIIDKTDAERYVGEHGATVLALQKSEQLGFPETFNFGKAKGLTRDDVVVIATGPIEALLLKGTPLSDKSACGFYVAVTRARYSVAIAVSKPEKTIAAMRESGSIWSTVNVLPH